MRTKSYHIKLGAGLDGLVMQEHDAPVPGPRQVLVRVRASSLNYREVMILIQGSYPLPVKPDGIPVSDGAGEVVAVGEGVSSVRVGDWVAGNVFAYWTDGPFAWETAAQLGGMLTQYALLPEEGVVVIPDHLSFEEAATLPCAGVTAWNARTRGRTFQAGDTVLTLGSGGVSLFALQFAKLFGARVIASTSSWQTSISSMVRSSGKGLNATQKSLHPPGYKRMKQSPTWNRLGSTPPLSRGDAPLLT